MTRYNKETTVDELMCDIPNQLGSPSLDMEKIVKEKIIIALNLLSKAGAHSILRKVDGSIHLELVNGSIIVSHYGIQIYNRTNSITLNRSEFESLNILSTYAGQEICCGTVIEWNKEKERVKQTNQFGIISKSLQQDMKEINEILKRWEKLLNNLPN